MTRGGQAKNHDDGPERKCIATGDVQPRDGLIRFVLGPDGRIVPDLAGKLPGRGVYVSANRAAIDKAAAKGLFSRAMKQPVKLPDGLSDLIEQMLAKRVIDLISLARKSGQVLVADGRGLGADPGGRRLGSGQVETVDAIWRRLYRLADGG